MHAALMDSAVAKGFEASLADTSELALVRSGLRFTSDATEAEYRTWHVHEAIPLLRISAVVSIYIWIAVLVILSGVSAPFLGWIVGWVAFVILPLLAAGLVSSYRRIGWVLPIFAIGGAVTGLTGVCICFWSLRMPELSSSAASYVTMFAFAIFRLRFAVSSAVAATFVVLHQILTIGAYEAGSISGAQVVLYSMVPYFAYATGMLACATIERSSRLSFRQERIIEAQRQTIERERTRADVAERSRELTEALSRLTAAGRASRLLPGDVVDERYCVVRALGVGGMGEVHEVERIADTRRFALKVLTGATDRDALMRFAREAQIAVTVDHPNVVSVVDLGVAPSGMFLVMELVAGGPLVAARSRYGDATWAILILRQVADALAAMHGRGIVHRDLKPGNILLEGDRPKITDFGIASLAEAPPVEPVRGEGATVATSSDNALTRTGMILGTPLYMAPELTNGARDARSSADMWSFGVIAHELLAAKVPFAEPPLLARLSGRPMPALASLAGALDADVRSVLDRCLELEPTARPTARAVHDALTR